MHLVQVQYCVNARIFTKKREISNMLGDFSIFELTLPIENICFRDSDYGKKKLYENNMQRANKNKSTLSKISPAGYSTNAVMGNKTNPLYMKQ